MRLGSVFFGLICLLLGNRVVAQDIDPLVRADTVIISGDTLIMLGDSLIFTPKIKEIYWDKGGNFNLSIQQVGLSNWSAGGASTFAFNTALAFMMEFVNELYKLDIKNLEEDELCVLKESLEFLVIMMTPFAPHLSSELWNIMGKTKLVVEESWPLLDTKSLLEETKLIVVQVNGKLRAKINIPTGLSEDKVKECAFSDLAVKKYTDGKNIKKVIYVEGKLLSIAVSDN